MQAETDLAKTDELTALRKRYPQNYPIPPDELDEQKLLLILEQELVGWSRVSSPLPENPSQERVELYREYLFKSFDQVLEYMQLVAPVCNTLPHHPRWENTWATLKVYLSSWDSNHIISYKDIMLARHMEKIYAGFGATYIDLHTARRIDKEQSAFIRSIEALRDRGDLSEAFAQLNQYLLQPRHLERRALIEAILSDYNRFTSSMLQVQMTRPEIAERTAYFKDQITTIIQSLSYFKPTVFFSYAWGNERETVVDALYESLEKDSGFELIRDKVNLGYKGLISEFMQGIGKGNFVVIAISDKYLRSEYCMFELYELFRNSNLENSQLLKKIYPIRVEAIDLNDPAVLRGYLTYWRDLEAEWKSLVNEFDADQNKYRRIRAIRTSISELLPFLNDINSMSTDLLASEEFAIIKAAIRERVANPA